MRPAPRGRYRGVLVIGGCGCVDGLTLSCERELACSCFASPQYTIPDLPSSISALTSSGDPSCSSLGYQSTLPERSQSPVTSSSSPGTKADELEPETSESPPSPGTKAKEPEPETSESPPSPGTKTDKPEPETGESPHIPGIKAEELHREISEPPPSKGTKAKQLDPEISESPLAQAPEPKNPNRKPENHLLAKA